MFMISSQVTALSGLDGSSEETEGESRQSIAWNAGRHESIIPGKKKEAPTSTVKLFFISSVVDSSTSM